MSYAKTEVAQIVAISNNRCIGKDGKMPWHLSEDLQRFKRLTTNDTDAYADSGIKGIVIMGRKTFESIGKPLPNRVNFIVTTQMDYAEKQGLTDVENVHVVHNLDDALTHGANIAHGLKFDTLWVIGGEQVCKTAMMFTDRIELTEVDTEIADGDAFFPKLPADFTEVEASDWQTDADSGLQYRFVTYERKSEE